MHRNVKYKNGTKFYSWINANATFQGSGPEQSLFQNLSTKRRLKAEGKLCPRLKHKMSMFNSLSFSSMEVLARLPYG